MSQLAFLRSLLGKEEPSNLGEVAPPLSSYDRNALSEYLAQKLKCIGTNPSEIATLSQIASFVKGSNGTTRLDEYERICEVAQRLFTDDYVSGSYEAQVALNFVRTPSRFNLAQEEDASIQKVSVPKLSILDSKLFDRPEATSRQDKKTALVDYLEQKLATVPSDSPEAKCFNEILDATDHWAGPMAIEEYESVLKMGRLLFTDDYLAGSYGAQNALIFLEQPSNFLVVQQVASLPLLIASLTHTHGLNPELVQNLRAFSNAIEAASARMPTPIDIAQHAEARRFVTDQLLAQYRDGDALAHGMFEQLEEIAAGKQPRRELKSGYDSSDLFRRYDLGEMIASRLESGEMPLDLNGHWENGRGLRNPYDVIDLTMISCEEVPSEDLKPLRNAIRHGESLGRFVSFASIRYSGCCTNCSEKFMLETDGVSVRAASACPVPEGVFPLDVEVNVPSGKLVFANDLREWFPIFGNYNVNSNHGIAQTIKKHAEFGMLHAHVGNSCPSIFRANETEFSVSHLPSQYDFKSEERQGEAEEETGDSNSTKEMDEFLAQRTPPGEQIGRISTDLWWWSGVDHSEFRRRFGGNDQEFKQLLESLDAVVVDVPPGVYRMTHLPQGWKDNFHEAAPYHYSTLTRVREPDPLEDFNQKININMSAGQVLLNSLRNYPTLYVHVSQTQEEESQTGELDRLLNHRSNRNEIERLSQVSEAEFLEFFSRLSADDQVRSLAAAADQILCTNGNGIDFHPNGWPLSDPDLSESDTAITIPIFDRKLHWYDLSPGFCEVCRAAGMHESNGSKSGIVTEGGLSFREGPVTPLNQSFRELAFNVLQSIIRYGVEVSGRQDRDTFATRSVAVAKVAFARLARMYPDDVPEYCRDLVGSLN